MADTWAERIIEALRLSRLPLDDDQLARRLGASQRQTINQTCRRLERGGLVRRYQGSDGKIVNTLASSAHTGATNTSADGTGGVTPRPGPAAEGQPLSQLTPTTLLTEDQVKAAVKTQLETEGWTVRVAWGRERGIDIAARRNHQHLYLEAKGEAANPPQQVNYFLGALGELVQRLSDPTADYGLTLPDNAQYRGLVDRLPALARDRLRLAVYFVGHAPEYRVRCQR